MVKYEWLTPGFHDHVVKGQDSGFPIRVNGCSGVCSYPLLLSLGHLAHFTKSQ